MQIETPKSSGSSSAAPRRLTLSAYHHKRFSGPDGVPTISSPLATSSPMVRFIASADRPQYRPPPKPASNKVLPIPSHQQAMLNADIGQPNQSQQAQQHPAGSRTNTIRSADLSSIFTTPEEAAYDIRHGELLQLIQAQRELVEQATAAIVFCRKKYAFNGTLQELSAQRLLLISRERLTLFNRQLDELKDQRFASNFTPHLEDIPESVDFENEEGGDNVTLSLHGMTSINGQQAAFYSLYIDKFVLKLNPSFSMKKIDKEFSYAFVMLCRYGDYIHATQVANVLDVGELRNNKVKVKELIIFDGLPPDFCIMVEVFALKIGKRWDHKWQSVWDFATKTFRNLKRTLTPSGAANNNTTEVVVGNNNNKTKNNTVKSFSASSVLTQQHTSICSEFQRCGYLHLNRDSLALGKEKFFLSDADYPLEGSIEVYARFAANNSPMEPPRPDSADRDLPIAGGCSGTEAINAGAIC